MQRPGRLTQHEGSPTRLRPCALCPRGPSLTPHPPTPTRNARPPQSKPDARVAVDVAAVSYIGARVSEAAMSVTWSTAKARGLATIVTDATGAGQAVIDLGALPPANASAPGDTLSVRPGGGPGGRPARQAAQSTGLFLAC
jgi:hypothetical protein